MKVLIQGVNLANEEGWDGKGGGLPPDTYLFQCMDVEHKPTSKGNPQMILGLEVVDAVGSQAHIGRATKHFIVTIEKTKGRVKQMLDVCGVPIEADGGFDSDHFVGTQFVAVVETNTFTQLDASTGQNIEKVNTKICGERSAQDWETILAEAGVGGGAATVAAPVAQPAPAVAARPAPARQQAPLPAPGAAPALAAAADAGVPAGQPRVATGLPRPNSRVAVRAR